MKKIMLELGYYEIYLDDLLKSKNISINRLMRDTNTDFKVIKRFMNGDMSRIDIIVLARFCDYLDCFISDILVYKKLRDFPKLKV